MHEELDGQHVLRSYSYPKQKERIKRNTRDLGVRVGPDIAELRSVVSRVTS